MRTAIVIATGRCVMITDETHAWYVAEDGSIYKPQEIEFTQLSQVEFMEIKGDRRR